MKVDWWDCGIVGGIVGLEIPDPRTQTPMCTPMAHTQTHPHTRANTSAHMAAYPQIETHDHTHTHTESRVRMVRMGKEMGGRGIASGRRDRKILYTQ